MNIVRRKEGTKYGYVYVSEEGKEIEITSKTTDGYLRLPKESPWKMVQLKKLEECEGDFELGERTITRGKSNNSTPKISVKSWENYITDDEKKIIEEIKLRAIAKMNKVKIEAQIAALEAQLAGLEEEAE